jgi:RNA ligase (TIGR02306 family)
MERKLASVQRIREIRPIEGADAIELAIINSWQVVVAKNVGHKVDDFVVYCEIDSFLPIREEFEFLRKSSYKKMGDQEGFRLKTIKLRGQVSQGLIVPIHVLPLLEMVHEGQDVTEILGILKYEPPVPAQLAGQAKGYFPGFIRKTDEERVQNLTKEYGGWIFTSAHKFYATEKLDGSSATFYVRDGEFGVCSRNLELSDPGEFVPGNIMCDDGIERPKQENTFWKVAREMDIKKKLLSTHRNICVQGELIGEGIQKNPYKIKGHTVRFYNAFDIDKQERLSIREFLHLMETLGFETVPILSYEFQLPETIEELLKSAEAKSILNSNTDREGIVIRSWDMSISFKAISNKFLMKNED